MGRRLTAIVVASAGLAGLLPDDAPAADAGATLLLSRPSGLGALPSTAVNHSFTGQRTISADGRFVTFISEADGLSPDDRNEFLNVFVRDTQTGATELVSRSTGGTAANGDSLHSTISSDGTRVAFESSATNLDDADFNDAKDIYLHVRGTGTTTLVSRATTSIGAVGDGPSQDPALSADGMQIVFSSEADNFSTEDADAQDIFLRDLDVTPPVTRLISRGSGTSGVTLNARSSWPSIDAAGTHVAFESEGAFVTPADNNSVGDVYLRDLSGPTPQTELVSRGGTGDAVGNGLSQVPAISGNADRVAFLTRATNFDDDTNTRDDVHVRDLSSNTTFLASRANGALGAVANGRSSPPAINSSGSAVAFAAMASNLVAGLPDASQRVFVRRPLTSSTLLASRDMDDQPAQTTSPASISADGASVVFHSEADRVSDADDDDFQHVYVRRLTPGTTEYVDRPSGTAPFVGGGASSILPSSGRSVSADGRYIVFASGSNAFFPGFSDDERFQIYRRDIATGDTVLVSRANGPDGAPGFTDFGSATISADGSRVAFDSTANGLVDGDNDGTNQVFVRDVTAGTTVMASRADGPDGTFTDAAQDGVISGDGTRVAFSTSANWAPGDGDGQPDVLLRDLTTARTTLVSRADGPDGGNAPESSRLPSIDHTGNRIAFESGSTFDPDASSPGQDIYVRDVAAGTTRLASRGDGAGPPGNDVSYGPDISSDGRRVAFSSLAGNLVSPDVNGASDVFVRDVEGATTALASRANGAAGAQADDGSGGASISGDGRRVAYVSLATNLGGGTDGAVHAYLRDLSAASTELVSRPDGTGGSLANAGTRLVRLNGNGNCAAFDSDATNLVADGYGTPDFTQVYLRVLSGSCPVPVPSSGGGGGGGGDQPLPPGTTADTLAPTLDQVGISRKKFRVGSGATAVTAGARRKRTPAGTRFKWRLSEAATVTLRIERGLTGRRKGSRCVKPTRKLRKAKKCTRWSRVGTLTRKSGVGSGGTAFSGRIGKKKLAAGSYRAVVSSKDAAGNASRSRTVAFRVVRR